MRYGLPYKGSKSQIAMAIINHLPCADNFYDLFCGGCAMTHAALLSQKFNNVIFNDIYAPISQLFLDAIHGKYADERRWISREDFQKLKDTDPYIKFCWSFGNNGKNYLYAKEIEPWKKAFHYAVVFGDTSLFEQMGIDIILSDRLGIRRQIANNYERYKEQYIKWYGSTVDFPDKKHSGGLESLERLQRLQRLQRFNVSYDQVPIKPNSVIYCDIPYQGTDTYDYVEAFDYNKFFDWCERQTEPVFISSYDMPKDRFRCVLEISKNSLFSGKGAKAGIERLFVPINQEERGNVGLFD